MSVDEMESLVSRLCHKYSSTLHLVSTMEKTELRPSDNYIVMASHVLWDLWQTTRKDKYFYQAVGELRSAARESPSNWQLKLMLIR